jgi:hypothetical protein
LIRESLTCREVSKILKIAISPFVSTFYPAQIGLSV